MAKRLIDADALYEKAENAYKGASGFYRPIYRGFVDMVADALTVDAVEVVRCRDCKYWDNHSICEVHSEWPDQYNTGHSDYTEPDDFCSYGERKEG